MAAAHALRRPGGPPPGLGGITDPLHAEPGSGRQRPGDRRQPGTAEAADESAGARRLALALSAGGRAESRTAPRESRTSEGAGARTASRGPLDSRCSSSLISAVHPLRGYPHPPSAGTRSSISRSKQPAPRPFTARQLPLGAAATQPGLRQCALASPRLSASNCRSLATLGMTDEPQGTGALGPKQYSEPWRSRTHSEKCIPVTSTASMPTSERTGTNCRPENRLT
jgi:hypothetical protein